MPLLGLLLIIAAVGIGFVLSKPVGEAIGNFILSNTPDAELDNDVLQLVGGVLVGVIVLLFTAALYAIFAPKPTKLTSERELKHEKEAKLAEELARKKRKQEVNRKMAEETKRKMGNIK